jgi:hypothetical protein
MTACVHTWGSTAAERAAAFPCDAHLPGAPMTLWRAVDVAAPPEVVFRWLCQLRAAPYSYDLLDNFGRRSPQALTPGLEQLEVGQRFMTIFRLVDLEPGRSITVRHRGAVFGEVVVTYRVTPAGEAASRLVAKLAVAPPGGPIGWAGRAVLPAGDLVMMRRQLLNLRDLAQRDAAAAG